MQYWLLTTEYPPFYGGGISTYCHFTARMLTEKGHAVTVFVNDSSVGDVAVESANNIRVIRFNPLRSASLSFMGQVASLSYEFAQVVKSFIEKEGQPDVIEAQEYLGIAYYLLQFKHLQYDWCKTVPVVITMHSPSFLYLEYNQVPLFKYPNFWIGEMERFSMQAADLLIAPSRYILEEVKKRFALTNPVVAVIPNPYEVSGKVVTPERESENQIIFYGKLSVQKGIFELLNYFRRLWDGGFTEPLYLIGGQDIVYQPEGKMMGDIVRKQNQQYIQKGLLILEGQIAPERIAARLAKAKVVIVPSVVENLPYVVFEMMELGKVLLVSKQGGHAEVIEEGRNGFVFDHEAPESFTRQLKSILDKSFEDRQTIGRRAYDKLISCYNFDSIYLNKLKAIEKVIYKDESNPLYPFVRVAANSIKEQGEVNSLLSIVVPFYNMGAYIDETIESLQQAGYPYKEIIIVNDGSTDTASLRKLERYRDVSGLRVIDTPNRGLSSARNTGAEHATGTYLAFLDADDMVRADYYSKAINVLCHFENVAFVGCWVQYFEDSQKVWPAFTPEPPLILYHNLVNSSALVYRRSVFLACGRNDSAMRMGLEDYDSVIALAAKGYYGVVLPEVLFQYRVRKGSMARGISRNKKLFLYQYISNKHRELYAKFATDIFNLSSANGTGIVLDNPTLDFTQLNKSLFNNKIASTLITQIKKNRVAKKLAYRVYRIINK